MFLLTDYGQPWTSLALKRETDRVRTETRERQALIQQSHNTDSLSQEQSEMQSPIRKTYIAHLPFQSIH